MTRKIILITALLLGLLSSQAQSFLIGPNIRFADLRVEIQERLPFADLSVLVAERAPFADFTIGFTEYPKEATFVISRSPFADYKIQAAPEMTFKDLSISAGAKTPFPDIRIAIEERGRVDYLIFCEKPELYFEDIVIALLPAIHFHMEEKNEVLAELFDEE